MPDDPYVPGLRWCAIAAYYDGSGIRGVFGPYKYKAATEKAVKALQEIGVFENDDWTVMPLRKIDPGIREAPDA